MAPENDEIQSERLKSAIKRVAPDRAEQLLQKYRVVREGLDNVINNALVSSPAITAQCKSARTVVDSARDHFLDVSEHTEPEYDAQKRTLLDNFSDSLDDISESLQLVSMPSAESEPQRNQRAEDAIDTYLARLDETVINERPFSDEELKKHYRAIAENFPENDPALIEAANSYLQEIRSEFAARRVLTMKDEIKKRLKAHSAYITISEDEEGLLYVVLDREEFEKLPIEKQLEIQQALLSIQVSIILKKEEANLELESREFMIAFYRGNQAMAQGDYINAKKLYLEFLEKYEGINPENRKEALNNPEVVVAMTALEKIAEHEIGLAEARLSLLERSVESTPSLTFFPRSSEKYGSPKAIAQKMFRAQRDALDLARKLIAADNNILTFEDAMDAINGIAIMDEKTYRRIYNEPVPEGATPMGAYLARSGIGQLLNPNQLGDWRTHGVAYYASGFGTNFTQNGQRLSMEGSMYIPELDAITAVINEQGTTDPEKLFKIAEGYKARGLYEVAENIYDICFRDLYEKHAKRKLDRETFIADFKKDKKKMRQVEESILAFAREREEKEGGPLSPEEREMMRSQLIDDAWKTALRGEITEVMSKPENRMSELGQRWSTFNAGILQIDRKWYEIWKMTCREWDQFLKTLPYEILMIMFSAGAAKALREGVEPLLIRAIIRQELRQLGITEAFRQGGKRLALELIAKKLGVMGAGFLLESVTFAEVNALSHGLTNGSPYTLTSWKSHLRAWGHSIVTLGVIKGVGAGIAATPLQNLSGVRGMVLRTGVGVTADTVGLTGANLGLMALADESMTESQVAAMIRDNVVLSLGVRAGHGLLGAARRSIEGVETERTVGMQIISRDVVQRASERLERARKPKNPERITRQELTGLAKSDPAMFEALVLGMESVPLRMNDLAKIAKLYKEATGKQNPRLFAGILLRMVEIAKFATRETLARVRAAVVNLATNAATRLRIGELFDKVKLNPRIAGLIVFLYSAPARASLRDVYDQLSPRLLGPTLTPLDILTFIYAASRITELYEYLTHKRNPNSRYLGSRGVEFMVGRFINRDLNRAADDARRDIRLTTNAPSPVQTLVNNIAGSPNLTPAHLLTFGRPTFIPRYLGTIDTYARLLHPTQSAEITGLHNQVMATLTDLHTYLNNGGNDAGQINTRITSIRALIEGNNMPEAIPRTGRDRLSIYPIIADVAVLMSLGILKFGPSEEEKKEKRKRELEEKREEERQKRREERRQEREEEEEAGRGGARNEESSPPPRQPDVEVVEEPTSPVRGGRGSPSVDDTPAGDNPSGLDWGFKK